jgi:hypothetical protein
MADSVLARHTQSVEAVAAARSRSAALRAWTAMQAGQYADAHAFLDEIDPASPREQPWVWGLRVGLARRQDDIRALALLWVDARGVLVGHPVDLYSLLPLGEIGLAAARMHEPSWRRRSGTRRWACSTAWATRRSGRRPSTGTASRRPSSGTARTPCRPTRPPC